MFDDSHISSLYINSRNIINFKNDNTTEQLKDVIHKTVDYCQQLVKDHDHITSENSHLVLRLPQHQSNNITEERANLKISVKLFMYEWNPALVGEAIQFALKELGLDKVESLAIAFPEYCKHKTKPDNFKPIWAEAEKCYESGKVLSLGCSDLNKNQLENLVTWAKVKPTSNQINSVLSCIVPEDLTHYADQNAVILLTHNDKYKILADQDFQAAIKPLVSETERWKLSWVLRYVVSIKCREVLKEKGYLIKAVKGPQPPLASSPDQGSRDRSNGPSPNDTAPLSYVTHSPLNQGSKSL